MKKIYIEITNNCNLNCEFCHNTNRKKEYMTVENFEKIIQKVKNHTKIICLHVKGEPLLHPNLQQILEILKKYNLQTNITTNGILLNKTVDILLESGVVRQLNLSLHSCLENKNIDISKYMSNIFEAARKLKNSNIIISYRLWNLKTITENERNIELIQHLSNEYNIIDLQEKLKTNEWLKLENNTFINQDIQFVWPNLNSEIINEQGRCLAIKEQIAILVNGDVVPCCIDSEGDIVLGNILVQDINEILESERARNILVSFQNNCICEDLCRRCGFLERLESKRK